VVGRWAAGERLGVERQGNDVDLPAGGQPVVAAEGVDQELGRGGERVRVACGESVEAIGKLALAGQPGVLHP
jgi:hypothetical protein